MLLTRPSGDVLNIDLAGESGRPLLFLPAFGTPAGYYGRFADQLAEAGFQVAVLDWRGHGKSTPKISRRSRFRYRDLVEDVGAVIDSLGWDRGVTLAGHSFGGQLALLYAARTKDPRVGRLAVVAAATPHFAAYPGSRRFSVLLGSQTMLATSWARGYWPGWGFGGVQSRGTITDWARFVRTGRLPDWDGLSSEAALAGLVLPVLSVDVEGDTLTPPATVARLMDKLTSAPVTPITYTQAEAGAPIDHFKWARNGAALATRFATG